ncbi:N-acetyl-alpha-D-glucosaminyl L-malate synthase BshA [Croceimicrobium hydrocarbonivorans]|uniref:N-acetyl-alpha-D-glucosaminyl L-malate synthase BshA n=1 Tax=Croceimicrobium hydrocarbonivorans TaxID=2761580 RepID=A0A7H0VCY8_9FLAO|nr:N-acetyl-alpha-D-glucosaminyl L-malate synthase BshA [Croceimicrobium hydrocarbonivorans]QNR23586.1 N-acetyl-alpha-D-glucosaminyl L-malate synthase BshA [Croceimicrobium hydrocarbonivorans]
MNIGIVGYPTYGGSGVVATELSMYLAKQGHKIHFISYSQPVRLDVLEPNIYYHEVNVQDYPLFEYQPYELALSSKMVNVTLKYKLEVIHVHYAIPHAYAAYMAKQILREKGVDLPIVTTLHGTDITLVGRNPSYKQAVNFSINHSDVVTSVSESLKQDTLSFFNITKDIQVIPNFLDLSLYKPDDSCKHNFAEEGEKIVTHVSNFRKVKRIPDVIDVFFRLQNEMPAVLLMLGDGPEKERARKQAQDLGIAEKVKFLGKTSDVERILCISDLFILPSEKESFGLAALEAMGAGVPVISSNTGGLGEVNIHMKTGITADVGDIDAMAQGAIHILSDPQRHIAFAQAARAQAERFAIDEIMPDYLRVYHEAIAASNA